MKKNVFTILLIICALNIWAQQDSIQLISVNYKYIVRGDKLKNITFDKDFNLFRYPDLGISIYDMESVQAPSETNTSNNPEFLQWKPKGKNLNTLYKDYNKNEMYLKDMISFRFFVQKDSLTIIDWDIQDETKTILGYRCQAATTSFRGRNYKAWFTTALPVCGPWKFDNLPGAILEVKALDQYVSWEAKGITVKKQSSEVAKPENPFSLEKFLTWSEFKALYKQKAIADSKYKVKEGEEMNVVTPRMLTERYIDENDKDYLADKVRE
nr:GLPGLI family protein [uncultured Flavobacterium sp.]